MSVAATAKDGPARVRPGTLRVAAFTRGVNVPSARFRVRQLIPAVARQGVEMTEFTAPLGAYPPRAKALRPLWAVGTLGSRIPALMSSARYDVTLLQRTMISNCLTLEPFTKGPRVLDVDDAIWLNGRGDYAGRLAGTCDLVVCGNDYLADYFSRWNKNVVVLPTPVDTLRFKPLEGGRGAEAEIIGWSGSSSNFGYLYGIEDALAALLKSRPGARLRVVSDAEPSFSRIPERQFEFIKWTPENEAETIGEMTVGLMPLSDSEWERGKCSYKMLLYLACGVPAVVSPVGMNAQVLAMGRVGVGVTGSREWEEVLRDLLDDPAGREAMGQRGREIAVGHFGLDAAAPKLADFLRGVVGSTR
jgi:glycosyltransferase involved in cell wall biosynthesis